MLYILCNVIRDVIDKHI